VSLRIRNSHILELQYYYEEELCVNEFADSATLGHVMTVI